MPLPLSDRKALVTGASSGIGAASARVLARAGAELWLVARRQERLDALARELGRAHVVALDVRDHRSVLARLAGLPIDLLVDNAGLSIGVDKLAAGDPAEWAPAIDTNLLGALHVLRAVLPGMLQRARGDVVLIGSVAGRQVYPGGGVYCASKHALRAIYETLRLENVGSGLRFTTVDPGMVGGTEFSQVRMRGDEAKVRAVYQGVDALGPEDVAEAVLWAVTRPAHVNVGEIVLWASAQASTTSVHRRPG